jgi:hypothetical protein
MVYSQNQIENTLVERTIVITTGSLANNAIENGSVQIARCFKLKKISIDRACEIRLYGDSTARTNDAGRTLGDLSFMFSQSRYICGLRLDIITGLNWFMSPPAIGMNTDVPTTPTIYYSIKNTSGSTSTVTVTLKVIIEEV